MSPALEDPVALEKVLAWRTRGVSYQVIAQGMGISEEEARRLGKLAAARAQSDTDDEETMRNMQLYRLDLVEGRLIQWMDKQDAGERLIIRAVFLLLQVGEARARILGQPVKPLPVGRKKTSGVQQMSMEDVFMSDAALEDYLSGEGGDAE